MALVMQPVLCLLVEPCCNELHWIIAECSAGSSGTEFECCPRHCRIAADYFPDIDVRKRLLLRADMNFSMLHSCSSDRFMAKSCHAVDKAEYMLG